MTATRQKNASPTNVDAKSDIVLVSMKDRLNFFLKSANLNLLTAPSSPS